MDETEEMAGLVGDAAPEPPLGNFPDDNAPQDSAPADEAGLEEAAADEAVESSPPPATEASGLQALQQRLEAQERELQFLRLAQMQAEQPAKAAPEAPKGPLDDPEVARQLGQLQVSPQEWTDLLNNGPQSAFLISRALQATAYVATEMAKQATQRIVQESLQQFQGSMSRQQEVGQYRAAFLEANADLQPHGPVVAHFTREVAQEQERLAQAGRGRSWAEVSKEIAQRARAYLKSAGLVAKPVRAPGAQRMRPATAELSSNGRAMGRIGKTNAERDMDALVGEP